MTAFPRVSFQLIYFIAIGGTAALIHLSIVFNLVHYFQVVPLVANIIAFFITFNFSYLGHRYLTFAQLKNKKLLSLPHFFLVALSGGMINELLYFIVLRYTTLNYFMSLIVVLGLVAIYNFCLSRFWACR